MIEWIKQKPPLFQRILALSVLPVIVSLSWLILIVPLIDMHRSSVTTNRRLSARIQEDKSLIAAMPAIKENLATFKSAASDSSLVFKNRSEADAVAALQTQVQEFITQDGGTVQSIEPLVISPEGGLDMISIKLNFSLPIRDLPILLEQIETGTPFKFVSNAAIQSSDVTDMSTGSGSSGQQLSINWTVDAYCHVDQQQ